MPKNVGEVIDVRKRALDVINRARMSGAAGAVVYHAVALTGALEELFGREMFKELMSTIFTNPKTNADGKE